MLYIVVFDRVGICLTRPKYICSTVGWIWFLYWKKEDLLKFIKVKQEPKDDEAVYLDETNRLDLSFDEIKKQVILQLKNC